MAWVNALSKSEDDVFDEKGDDLNLLSKEWASNMKKRTRDGYVDGMDAAEEASLSVGFKQGYKEGATRTAVVGRLKGIVSAVCCWCQIHHPENVAPASVTDLLQRISQYEDALVEAFRMALENPPPSVTSVSESIEDLDMKQEGDSGCGGEGCKEKSPCGEGCKEKSPCGEGCKEKSCYGEGCKEKSCYGEGCKEKSCYGEGCKEKSCCRGGEKMDVDVPHPQQKPRSGSTKCSSGSGESLDSLLQRCMDVVSELGLPAEMIGHIQELKNMQ